MFKALCARRNIRFKHERFLAGMTAAAVYNVNRASAESPVFTAFDFVRSAEDSERKAETDGIKSMIKSVIGQLPNDVTRERLLDIRSRTIKSLMTQGRKDAEVLFDSCWPSLSETKQ